MGTIQMDSHFIKSFLSVSVHILSFNTSALIIGIVPLSKILKILLKVIRKVVILFWLFF